jgi:Acyl-CoA carboxylase epsilon subunit
VNDARESALRVVRGDATPDEVAALVTVLAALATAATPPKRPTAPGWSDRTAALRRPLTPAPGAWRASALPR